MTRYWCFACFDWWITGWGMKQVLILIDAKQLTRFEPGDIECRYCEKPASVQLIGIP